MYEKNRERKEENEKTTSRQTNERKEKSRITIDIMTIIDEKKRRVDQRVREYEKS